MERTTPGASGEPMPAPLAQRLQTELRPGEVLVWSGQPLPKLAARGAWIFSAIGGVMLIPMLLFVGFFILMLLVLKNAGSLICFLPFLCVLALMIAMLVGLPIFARRSALNTVYALTNQRVIIWRQGIFSLSVRSFSPDQLGEFRREERPDGSGRIIFRQSHQRDMDGNYHTYTVGFLAIAHVRDIEELIRATLLTNRN